MSPTTCANGLSASSIVQATKNEAMDAGITLISLIPARLSVPCLEAP
jgi:hypothetical protein